MITEQATVTRSDSSGVEIRLDRQSICTGCELVQGCGTGALGRLLGKRSRPLKLDADPRLRAGDRLRLGLSENALVGASLAIYGLPLLGMLAGGLIGALAGIADPWVIALSIAGFFAGFKLAARSSRRLEIKHGAPRIIDIEVNPAASSQSDTETQPTGFSR